MSTKPIPKKAVQPGLVSTLLSALYDGVVWIGFAVIGSIIIELGGMVIGWWDQNHAAKLLMIEKSYISSIENYPLVNTSPGDILEQRLNQFDSLTSPIQEWVARGQGTNVGYDYLRSAINIFKLIILRLITCVLSLPGYVFIGLAAGIDGLVKRDIRKFTGGHESSWIFHKAKRWVMPSIMGTLSIYVLMPFAISPFLIFAPSMIAFGFFIYISTSKFKKFL